MRPLFIAAALFLVASPAFAKLEISKIEACYGPLGPLRKSLDFYPYDTVCIRFRVAGAKADEDGNRDVEGSWKLLDDRGKEALAKKIPPAKGPLAFGTDSFPAVVNVDLPGLLVAGEYTLKVTMKDNLSGEETGFEKKVAVKAAEFAIVSPAFFHDADLKAFAPAGGVVGEALHFGLSCIGFDHSPGTIDCEMMVEVFDKDKKPLMVKPLVRAVKQTDKEIVKETEVIALGGMIGLTKAGEFTLRLTVTDRNSKKTATWEAPLKVTEP